MASLKAEMPNVHQAVLDAFQGQKSITRNLDDFAMGETEGEAETNQESSETGQPTAGESHGGEV
jgi:hypothetical protein